MPSIKDHIVGTVFQIGIVGESIESCIADQVRTLNIGPWYTVERFIMPLQKYRGVETPGLHVDVAFSFLGDMMYEIVVQKDAGPSVYRDTIDERGYGLHHLAYFTHDFDTEVERLKAQGYEAAFEVKTGPDLGNKRVTYMDTRVPLGVMLEVCEYSEQVLALFAKVQEKCRAWDGTHPIRRISDLA